MISYRSTSFLRTRCMKNFWFHQCCGVSCSKSAGLNVPADSECYTAKPFDKMPSLPMLPIIGTSWAYLPVIGRYSIKKMHLANRHRHQTYGDVVREKFGSLNIVFSFRAEDLETIFRNEGKYPLRGGFSTIKAYRESSKRFFKTPGLLNLDGKEWHDLRSKTQKHLLKPKAVQAYLGPMQEVASDFVQNLLSMRDCNEEVPALLEELNKWALESVTLVGLDTRLGCLARDLPADSDGMRMIRSVRTQMECLNKLEPLAGNIPFWKLFPTPTWKKFVKAADEYSEIIFKYVFRAKEDLKKNVDKNEDRELSILQATLSTKELEETGAMVMVADMIAGGIHTTANTVAFLLYHLAKNQEKQEILHQEIIKNLPNKNDKITPSVFAELKYLKACMKESARLCPITPANGRILDKEVIISGYKVPPKTFIVVVSQETSVDEKYFKNAQLFLPERWLDKSEKPYPFATLPFGYGTRSCVGRRLAELEIICLITKIIRTFKVEYHYEDIGLTFKFMNIPDRPLKLRFTERM